METARSLYPFHSVEAERQPIRPTAVVAYGEVWPFGGSLVQPVSSQVPVLPGSKEVRSESLENFLQDFLHQGLPSWLFKWGFKVSSGIVQWHLNSYGADLDSSKTATPVHTSPFNSSCFERCPRFPCPFQAYWEPQPFNSKVP